MLGFLEPEVDRNWPVSIALRDSKQLPPLREPKGSWRMWNDSFFPAIPQHSSPLLGAYAESSEYRSWSSTSSVPSEMERLYNGGFFLASHDSYIRTSSAPSVPHTVTVTTEGLSSSLTNYISGYGDELMATTAAIDSRISNSTPSHTDAKEKSQKHQLAEDKANKKAIIATETKKQKLIHHDKLHLPPSTDHPTASQRQLMKAPVKRSQKLGDKITALQQLVSPYGKTDTASVLHEASLYIKVLHDQIRVLTSPYFQTRSSYNQLDLGEASSSLRGRGLCLVPVSSPIIYLANQAFLEHRLPNSMH